MLITNEHLALAKETFQKNQSYFQLREAVDKRRQRKSDSSEVTIFLSHKHDELTQLESVIALLSSIGVKVYIDWMDNSMPDSTSGETAANLKRKIKENRKFILLASTGAIASKWCNWELGIGDGLKYPDHLAIMPIANIDQTWPGNEYLQIYPAIKSQYRYSVGTYYLDFKGSTTPLEKWLRS